MKLSKKESREILNNYEPMGICTLSNFGGVTIYNIEYELMKGDVLMSAVVRISLPPRS